MSDIPDERVTPAGRRADLLIPGVLIGLFVLARIFIVYRSSAYPFYDTTSYAPTSPTKVLSFVGHAPRPWGTPLLFSIMPTNGARAFADWFIGTAAWAVLAYALWMSLRSRISRILGVVAVLILPLTPSLVVWDFVLSAESLSVSLGILCLGLLMIWARTRSRAVFIGLIAAAFWWIFVRQDLLPMYALLVVTLIWYAWRRPGVRRAAIVGIVTLVIGAGWVLSIQPNIEKAFAEWGNSHYTLTEGTFLYRLRHVILRDPQMREAYFTEFGMPRCPEAEAIAKRGAWRMADFQASVRQCPELLDWMHENASSVAYKYALKHPEHYAAVTLRLAPEMLGGPLQGFYPTGSPTIVPDAVAWPSKPLILPLTAAITFLTLVAGVVFGLLRRRIWLYTAGFGLVAVSLASTVLGLMYTAGDYPRFGIQEAVGLRLGLVVLVVTTIDALVTRRTEAATAPADLAVNSSA